MRVYVAAPWTHKAEAQHAAEYLEAHGHTITKKWWEHREVPGYLGNATWEEVEELQQQAQEDLEGVASADAFVLLNLAVSEGKAVETGIALENALALFLLGGKSNLFHYDPYWTEIASIEELPALLSEIAGVEEVVDPKAREEFWRDIDPGDEDREQDNCFGYRPRTDDL